MTRRWTPLVVIGAVALAGQLIVLSGRDVLILEWRPTDLASIALNYYRHGFDFARPQVFWGGNGPGYVEMEFPLLPYTIARLYQLLGVHDWVALIPTLVCGIALPIVVFKLTRQLFTPYAALAAGLFAATAPTWLAMSTGVWPDPPPVLFAALGLHLLTRWVEDGTGAAFWLSGACLALAILLKLTSLYVGIPVLFLFWIKYQRRWWRAADAWAFAAIVLLPVIAWYAHAYRLFLESHNTFGILASGYSKFGSAALYSDPRFYAKTLARVVLFHVTPLGVALAAAGAFARPHRPIQYLPHVWIGAVIAYGLIAAEGVFLGHYQYALPIVPAAAVLAGVGVDTIWRRSLPIPAPALAAVLLANAITANYLLQTRGMDFRRLSEQKMRTGLALARVAEPDSLIVVVDADMNNRTPETSMTPPEVFYFADRRGWYRAMSWLTPTSIDELHAQGARYVAVSANHMRLFRSRYQTLYAEWSGKYRMLVDGEDGIIYDLTSAPADRPRS